MISCVPLHSLQNKKETLCMLMMTTQSGLMLVMWILLITDYLINYRYIRRVIYLAYELNKVHWIHIARRPLTCSSSCSSCSSFIRLFILFIFFICWCYIIYICIYPSCKTYNVKRWTRWTNEQDEQRDNYILIQKENTYPGSLLGSFYLNTSMIIYQLKK